MCVGEPECVLKNPMVAAALLQQQQLLLQLLQQLLQSTGKCFKPREWIQWIKLLFLVFDCF